LLWKYNTLFAEEPLDFRGFLHARDDEVLWIFLYGWMFGAEGFLFVYFMDMDKGKERKRAAQGNG
jgi:hypothetical protein